jgi:ectoine hydroxylase-related dioxygenase (phytanoyl-CoA dioxygenase family)
MIFKVAQSMYIFKQPKLTKTHENAVTDHIDSTFIHIDSPNGVLLGIWIALDDATIENGCLWFIPGSHKNLSSTNEPYRFARTRTKERKQDNNVPLLEFIGPKPEYDKSKFIPVQVKKGRQIASKNFIIKL